jgi:hypothetical protein
MRIWKGIKPRSLPFVHRTIFKIVCIKTTFDNDDDENYNRKQPDYRSTYFQKKKDEFEKMIETTPKMIISSELENAIHKKLGEKAKARIVNLKGKLFFEVHKNAYVDACEDACEVNYDDLCIKLSELNMGEYVIRFITTYPDEKCEDTIRISLYIEFDD